MRGATRVPAAGRPAALRQPVKWRHLESLESFTHRLLVANSLDAQALRLAIAPGLQEHRFRISDHAVFIEGLADRPAGHYERLRRRARPDPGPVYAERFLCRLCAAGERIEQVPHSRENWCLRHPGQLVWVGPGTTPETQPIVPFDAEQAKAERRFRQLVAAGRVDARLHSRAWEMVRDNAWLTKPHGWNPALAEYPDDREVRGRASLYLETVAVLEVLSDWITIERWQTRYPHELRDDIVRSLPPMHGPCEVLVERIVLWLRPLRREIRPTRVDPLYVPLDIVDVAAVIDTAAIYPKWIQRHPHAIGEWDWSRNARELDPWEGIHVSKDAWWVCDQGHSWQTNPLTRGQVESGCPYCAHQTVWPGHTDLRTRYPNIAAEWDHTPNVNVGDLDHIGAKSRRKVTWTCRQGHRWVAPVSNRTRLGSGCPGCSGRAAVPGTNDLSTRRPDLATEWDAERNGSRSPASILPGSAFRAWWNGACGHAWQASVRHRWAGHGCPYCSGRRAIPGETDLATLRPDLAAEWDSSNTLNPDQVAPYSKRKVGWRCASGHTWAENVASRSRSRGCPHCPSADTRRP